MTTTDAPLCGAARAGRSLVRELRTVTARVLGVIGGHPGIVVANLERKGAHDVPAAA